ncbi:MAG: DUF5053 domain-containing protein [Rikenellaceae bacterium]|jgi:hypothetical protein|nr:DUF5053 domain-containing protein [Rikenellaceae bacterium]
MMKNEILKLREQRHAASTDNARVGIDRKIMALSVKEPDAFAIAMVELAGETAAHAEELIVRDRIKEIIPIVSMAYIAKTYFNKTRAWLNQRINGSSVNGKPARFTPDEIDTLNYAIQDISRKLSSIHVPAECFN